jgi:hypothetical protein
VIVPDGYSVAGDELEGVEGANDVLIVVEDGDVHGGYQS